MNTPVGIQLYSVSKAVEKDFEGTLKKLSEMGYKGIEFWGFGGFSAKEIKAMLDRYNLDVWSALSPFDDLVNNYEETVAYHKAIGNKNFGIGSYDISTQEKLDRFVELVNPMVEKLKNDGMTFTYHNHQREFELDENGILQFEQLIYRTNMNFEIDVYWIYTAGLDPVKVMERLGNRVTLTHIKDGDNKKNGKPLGVGTAPIKECVDYVKAHNIPIIVENENFALTCFDEAEICINYLKELD